MFRSFLFVIEFGLKWSSQTCIWDWKSSISWWSLMADIHWLLWSSPALFETILSTTIYCDTLTKIYVRYILKFFIFYNCLSFNLSFFYVFFTWKMQYFCQTSHLHLDNSWWDSVVIYSVDPFSQIDQKQWIFNKTYSTIPFQRFSSATFYYFFIALYFQIIYIFVESRCYSYVFSINFELPKQLMIGTIWADDISMYNRQFYCIITDCTKPFKYLNEIERNLTTYCDNFKWKFVKIIENLTVAYRQYHMFQ